MKVKSLFILLFCITLTFAQTKKPKNIIIMIGDGMGFPSVSTSVIAFKDSPFKKFTHTGIAFTKCLDKLITDSGAGATAISTGYRTKYAFISVDSLLNPLTTIMEHAEKLKKSTGVVSTSSVTHATPAGFLAHVKNRSEETNIADDILVSNAEVVIGGGLSFFTPASEGGKRKDNTTLIPEIKKKGYDFFTNPQEFISNKSSNKVFALLDSVGVPEANKRNFTLAQLTNKALDVLKKDKDGFVLMVEGSQIDWGLHDHKQDMVLGEIKDFNGAINAALEFAEKDGNTLVVVTADHETGGMAIIEGQLDGSNLKMAFTTKGHTPELVGVFAKGPGAEDFTGLFDNFMTGRKLFKALDPKYKFKD